MATRGRGGPRAGLAARHPLPCRPFIPSRELPPLLEAPEPGQVGAQKREAAVPRPPQALLEPMALGLAGRVLAFWAAQRHQACFQEAGGPEWPWTCPEPTTGHRCWSPTAIAAPFTLVMTVTAPGRACDRERVWAEHQLPAGGAGRRGAGAEQEGTGLPQCAESTRQLDRPPPGLPTGHVVSGGALAPRTSPAQVEQVRAMIFGLLWSGTQCL